MDTFEIRHTDIQRRATAAATFHYFDVSSEEAHSTVAVAIGDSVGDLWEKVRTNGRELELRVALDSLRRHCANIMDPAFRGVFLTAQERLEVDEGWIIDRAPKACPYERKECRYQERAKAGLICLAAHPREPLHGQTTRAACESCGLPSTDILCDNLVYPQTVGVETDQRRLGKRSLVEAVCDVESQDFANANRDAKLCVPGGLSCWVQTYKVEEAAVVVVSPATQFSVGEAIDQLNMAFRTRYGRKLIHIEHARSIEDLVSECPTDDALQLKLQVLAGLLESMDLSGLVTEQETKGSKGTLDLLECLFKRDLPKLPGQHLSNLRSVNKLANAYPRHPRVKNIDRAHSELGLPYPLTDYGKAWAIIRETFIQTLRQIALHLS
jgi:hypothetical protein